MAISGVYAITNIENNKTYIGISDNIFRRWRQHVFNASDTKLTSKLYQAMRKHGIENFTFRVLEETDDASRENFWINKFDSINRGYNVKKGSEPLKGEAHPNHKLSFTDVKRIRTKKLRGENKHDVFSLYKNRISESGFEKIWYYQRCVGVMPD